MLLATVHPSHTPRWLEDGAETPRLYRTTHLLDTYEAIGKTLKSRHCYQKATCFKLKQAASLSQEVETKFRIISVFLRQADAIAAIAHLYTAMRSLHTHMDTHNLHIDTIAAGAYTYTLIRSLPLHTPTQLYDRCHCTNLHSDTIAVSTHTHTPTQRCNRCFFSLCPHTPTQTHSRCTSTQVSKAST